MKKLTLLFLLTLGMLSTYAQHLKFSTNTPEAGKPLSFEYNVTGGKLAMLANVKCYVATFINMNQKNIPVTLTKEGANYKGTFTPADSTAIAIFVFSADGTRDEDPNGYYTLFYKGGQPTGMAYYLEAQLYLGLGKRLAGIAVDKEKALKAYQNAFNADPEIKSKYIIAYLSVLYTTDKAKAEALINAEIKTLKAMKNPSEADMLKTGNLYMAMKRTASADSTFLALRKKYPYGTYSFNIRANAVGTEKDLAKKETLLAAIIKDFKLDANKKTDAGKLSNLYYTVASAYGLAKNNSKFEFYGDKVDNNSMRAGLYNTYAWAGAENKENLEFSAKISKRSLDLIKEAKNDPVPPYYSSKEEYLAGLDDTYATYADTYALLLDHLGRNAEALKYQEEAVTINKFTNPEMNERYVIFLRKNDKKDQLVTVTEKFIKDGQGTEKMKEALKSVYKGSESFDVYYAGLEKTALELERAKWAKEMINKPAPKFSLVNLKGETVSLEKLKGKVVIVDYWATWCGPCIASFPGMQKAVDKYKNDPQVVFLFINTAQTEEDREKVVKDYLATTPYTFNVLLDTKSKQDPSKFDVIEQYEVEGIPTKFVIDGNGNIRFKKVGFSGSAETTVKELDFMIEMARNAGNTK